jgi:hypothetical protein
VVSNHKSTLSDKEQGATQMPEEGDLKYIHIGDKIGTLVKDSVVQRSTIGASAKCPNCGREELRLMKSSALSAGRGCDMKIDELRRKMRETTEKDLIREAIRARNFSGANTLRQGMNLIDFALRVNKDAL